MKSIKKFTLVIAVMLVIGCVPVSSYAASRPAQVKGIYVTQIGNTTAKIKWYKVSNAKGYQIYRATSKSGKYSKIKTITSRSTTSYTNKSLTLGKTYYYKVRAYKKSGKKTKYGKYSTTKYMIADYMKPNMTCRLQEWNDGSKIVVSIHNNAKKCKVYLYDYIEVFKKSNASFNNSSDGTYSFTELKTGSKNININLGEDEGLPIYPGETVKITMEPITTLDYVSYNANYSFICNMKYAGHGYNFCYGKQNFKILSR